MKTIVFIKRKLFDGYVRQNSQTEFINSTDMVKIANMWLGKHNKPSFNFNMWLNLKSTQEFIVELEHYHGSKVKTATKGRNGETWLHPLLFIDLALAISPKLKIEVYGWIMDSLLSNRNSSGDSYKMMCGTLFAKNREKSQFSRWMPNVAAQIRESCGVVNWEGATEEQLILREKYQDTITTLANALKDANQAVRLGIAEVNSKRGIDDQTNK